MNLPKELLGLDSSFPFKIVSISGPRLESLSALARQLQGVEGKKHVLLKPPAACPMGSILQELDEQPGVTKEVSLWKPSDVRPEATGGFR